MTNKYNLTIIKFTEIHILRHWLTLFFDTDGFTSHSTEKRRSSL